LIKSQLLYQLSYRGNQCRVESAQKHSIPARQNSKLYPNRSGRQGRNFTPPPERRLHPAATCAIRPAAGSIRRSKRARHHGLVAMPGCARMQPDPGAQILRALTENAEQRLRIEPADSPETAVSDGWHTGCIGRKCKQRRARMCRRKATKV
jgi:hypothetical protein